MEILEYESIMAFFFHIGMDPIDRDDVGKGETVQLTYLSKTSRGYQEVLNLLQWKRQNHPGS